eukprot:scaffold21616_cov112-Skeletonema_marinoi.AAC.1
MATVLRGDLRVGAGAADDKPMVLVGESTFPPIVPIRDTDTPLRRGVGERRWRGSFGWCRGWNCWQGLRCSW